MKKLFISTLISITGACIGYVLFGIQTYFGNSVGLFVAVGIGVVSFTLAYFLQIFVDKKKGSSATISRNPRSSILSDNEMDKIVVKKSLIKGGKGKVLSDNKGKKMIIDDNEIEEV